jgi:predicted Zn-dependent peptidase
MTNKVNKTVLCNGIRVVSQKMPHLKSVSIGIWVNVGARDETLSESGLSHFIEHMIFKGTDKRTAFDIAKEFDIIGGQTNAFTSMETTCYYAKAVDSHLKTVVDILSDIFLNSVFHEKEIERERLVILQEIGMLEDNPDEYVHFLNGNNFWRDNSLGRSILGTRENVSGFDADTIRKFFNLLYQPDRIVISVAGNIDHEKFVDLIRPDFESIKQQNSFPKRKTPEPHFNSNIYKKKIEQTHICLGTQGIPVTSPQRYAFSVMNTILGGNMSSRLFQQIRERRGLAYSVYSFASSHSDTGMFGAYTGIEGNNTSETIKLIIKELSKLKNKRVSSDELNYAKEHIKGGMMLASESNDNQMVRMAQNELNLGKAVSIQNVADNIDAVTKNDVIELAQVLFQTGRISLTILGPVSHKNKYDDLLVV